MKKVLLPFLLLALAIPGMAGTQRYRKPDHRPTMKARGNFMGGREVLTRAGNTHITQKGLEVIMGKCIYCGGDAGFLRRKHKECYLRELQRMEIIRNEMETKRQQDEQIALDKRMEAQKIKDAQE